MMSIEEIKSLVRETNASLCYYSGSGSISVLRTPGGEHEHPSDIGQYIECRLNYEAFRVPELRPYAEAFDGHLFVVTEILGADERRKKFSQVRIEICKDQSMYLGETDFLEAQGMLEKIIGGTAVVFGNGQKRIKIRIV